MKKSFLIFIFISALVSSCTKDKIKIDPNNPLLGVWNYASQEANALVFTRSQEFSDGYCYRFNADGTLIERNISGWCGTPPVSYTNYQGNWAMVNDTLIKVDVIYYDGKRNYMLDIESVNTNSLKLVLISGID
jgi:hypothetical protein